jgi:hypothetical protein
MRTQPHPWNFNRGYFAAHVKLLPPCERRRVLSAERAYVAMRDAPFSTYSGVSRDFFESMVAPDEKLDMDNILELP